MKSSLLQSKDLLLPYQMTGLIVMKPPEIAAECRPSLSHVTHLNSSPNEHSGPQRLPPQELMAILFRVNCQRFKSLDWDSTLLNRPALCLPADTKHASGHTRHKGPQQILHEMQSCSCITRSRAT